MAMIMCPECRRMVSDMAAACPRCGYPVSSMSQNVQAPIPPVPFVPRRTELGPVRGSKIGGIAMILFGIISMPLTLAMGIICVIGSFILMFIGGVWIVGERKGTCPYCGASIAVSGGSENYRCHTCKNLCIVKGNYLEESPH